MFRRMAGLALLAAALMASAEARARSSCASPKLGSDAAPLLSPPLGEVVIGKGRLQFYSAPDFACPIADLFVIPGDDLIAYGQSKDFGWTSVIYNSPHDASVSEGWVRTKRLKVTGDMGPRQ
jgi:hypothetical protein